MQEDSLTVDFADLADVRAKLPHARAILERKRSELAQAQTDLDTWTGLVDILARIAGVSPDAESEKADAPDAGAGAHVPRDQPQPLDLVVEVVNREVRKIRARDVTRILAREGYDFSAETVSNALYYAAKRAKPARIRDAPGRGFYAPLAYKEELIFDSTNGSESGHDLEPEGRIAPEGDGTGHPHPETT